MIWFMVLLFFSGCAAGGDYELYKTQQEIIKLREIQTVNWKRVEDFVNKMDERVMKLEKTEGNENDSRINENQ